MSGVATGQVFTEPELSRILDWYHVVEAHGADVLADYDLAEKVRGYHFELSVCRVPA